MFLDFLNLGGLLFATIVTFITIKQKKVATKLIKVAIICFIPIVILWGLGLFFTPTNIIITLIITFIVLFVIGIPAAIAGMCGNYIGSQYVINKGNKLIRPVFLVVFILLFMKICYDLFM